MKSYHFLGLEAIFGNLDFQRTVTSDRINYSLYNNTFTFYFNSGHADHEYQPDLINFKDECRIFLNLFENEHVSNFLYYYNNTTYESFLMLLTVMKSNHITRYIWNNTLNMKFISYYTELLRHKEQCNCQDDDCVTCDETKKNEIKKIININLKIPEFQSAIKVIIFDDIYHFMY